MRQKWHNGCQKYSVYAFWQFLLKFDITFENEHHQNIDLGEIYPFILLILPHLPPGIKNSGFGVWTRKKKSFRKPASI